MANDTAESFGENLGGGIGDIRWKIENGEIGFIFDGKIWRIDQDEGSVENHNGRLYMKTSRGPRTLKNFGDYFPDWLKNSCYVARENELPSDDTNRAVVDLFNR